MTLSKSVPRTVWNVFFEMNAIADTVRSTHFNNIVYCHCPLCAIQTCAPKMDEKEPLPEEKIRVGKEKIVQGGSNQEMNRENRKRNKTNIWEQVQPGMERKGKKRR